MKLGVGYDSGKFRCIAVNEAGTVNSLLERVDGGKKFINNLLTIYQPITFDMTFCCLVNIDQILLMALFIWFGFLVVGSKNCLRFYRIFKHQM